MSVFVDTSALYAVRDADDDAHTAALEAWTDLIHAQKSMCTSNYVRAES